MCAYELLLNLQPLLSSKVDLKKMVALLQTFSMRKTDLMVSSVIVLNFLTYVLVGCFVESFVPLLFEWFIHYY